ncbi:MAG: PQQ-binding-like beta-propeller repeat protein [Haloferacaceae archaeon]
MARFNRRAFIGLASAAIGASALTSNALTVDVEAADSQATAWSQYQRDAANTGVATTAGPSSNLEPRWEFDDGGNMGAVSAPALADGTLYFSTTEGEQSNPDDGGPTTGPVGSYVHAVDAESGAEQWRVETDGYNASPAVADGAVLVATYGDELLALEADTGEVRWTTETTRWQENAPTVADGTVYSFDSDRGGVRALSIADGSELWSHQPEIPGSPTMSTPAVADGTVFVDYDADSGLSGVSALDADTGERLWQHLHDYGHHFPPTVAGDTVIVRGADTLFAYDAADGTERWRGPASTNSGGAYYQDVGSAAVADGTVYAPDGDDLVALDLASGDLQWRFGAGEIAVSSAPVVADGTVYVGTVGGGFYALEAASGAVRGQFVPDTDLRVYEPPAVVDGTAYVGFFHQNSTADVGQGMYALEVGDSAAASARPTATVSVSPDQILREMPVTFSVDADVNGDLEGTGEDGQFRWAFGDGTSVTTSSETVEHAFEESGSHEVTLTVTNDYGWAASTTREVDVADETYTPPEPKISTHPANAEDRTFEQGATVTLDASGSEGGSRPIESYAWDVDADGGFERDGETTDLTLEFCGERTVVLRLTDELDVSVTAEITLETT